MKLTLKRLYIIFLTLGMVCNIGITLLFYAQSIKVINATSKEKLKSILHENSTIIENHIENTELLSHTLKTIITTTIPFRTLKDDPEAMATYKEEISPLFLNTIKTFNARTGWIVFDDYMIENAGILSYTKENGTYQRQPDYNIRNTTYAKDSWWLGAVINGSAWSDPYYWKRWDATIITYSEQVKVDDQIIGVIGSDLFFDDIYNQLSSIKIYDTGYVTLLNEEYEILYDPNKQIIGHNYAIYNNNQYSKIVDEIELGKEFDVIEFYDGEKEKIIGYHRIQNGWILIANPNKYEMYDDLNKLNFVLIIVFIVMIVLIQFYGWVFNKLEEKGNR